MALSLLEIQQFLATQGSEQTALFTQANEIRAQNVGDAVHLRGLLEISSYCAQNCFYCGLRREHIQLARYRIPPEEIIRLAKEAIKQGFKTIVLQSGEDAWFSAEKVAHIISEIKKSKVAVTLSLGERPREDFQCWKEAGADRYLLRLETSSPDLYAQLHPGQSWANRVRCLEDLRELGYEVGSGFIIGLPGQSLELLAQDLKWLVDFEVDMAGLGPFIAHPQTPLGSHPSGGLDLALKAIATTRLLLPDINLPATTALDALSPDGRWQALQAGANVLMPNLTPLAYQQRYNIYPDHHEACSNLSFKAEHAFKERLAALGRYISTDLGGHKKASL